MVRALWIFTVYMYIIYPYKWLGVSKRKENINKQAVQIVVNC